MNVICSGQQGTHHNVRDRWVAVLLRIRRTDVQIQSHRPAILIEIDRGFLRVTSKFPRQDLKLGNGSCLKTTVQVTNHSTSPRRMAQSRQYLDGTEYFFIS